MENNNKKNKLIYNLLTVVIVVLVILLAWQLFNIGSYYYDLWVSSKTSDEAKDVFDSFDISINDFDFSETASPSPTEIATEKPEASTETPESQAPVAEPTPRPEIQALREKFDNNDIIGYIHIEDTNISYPVVQTDNNLYYLDHTIKKEKNVNGALFLDEDNNKLLTDFNSIIYGHNMKNGTMFHNLRYYRDKDYYQEHKYIIFVTLDGESLWEVFSAYPTSTESSYIKTKFNSDKEKKDFISMIKKSSLYKTDVEVTENDIILTLSTCTNTAADQRFALHAKKVR